MEERRKILDVKNLDITFKTSAGPIHAIRGVNFDLYQGSQLIARISQEWLRLTSTYHVEVYDEAFNDLVISLVIAIDCVKADQAAAASSASH